MNMKVPSSVNPLMPKRCFCASIQFLVFKKQMLQAANTDLFNPVHSSECQTLKFTLKI